MFDSYLNRVGLNFVNLMKNNSKYIVIISNHLNCVKLLNENGKKHTRKKEIPIEKQSSPGEPHMFIDCENKMN